MVVEDLVLVGEIEASISESLPGAARPASTLVRESCEPRATTRLLMVESLPASLLMVLKWRTLRSQFCKDT